MYGLRVLAEAKNYIEKETKYSFTSVSEMFLGGVEIYRSFLISFLFMSVFI